MISRFIIFATLITEMAAATPKCTDDYKNTRFLNFGRQLIEKTDRYPNITALPEGYFLVQVKNSKTSSLELRLWDPAQNIYGTIQHSSGRIAFGQEFKLVAFFPGTGKFLFAKETKSSPDTMSEVFLGTVEGLVEFPNKRTDYRQEWVAPFQGKAPRFKDSGNQRDSAIFFNPTECRIYNWTKNSLSASFTPKQLGLSGHTFLDVAFNEKSGVFTAILSNGQVVKYHVKSKKVIKTLTLDAMLGSSRVNRNMKWENATVNLSPNGEHFVISDGWGPTVYGQTGSGKIIRTFKTDSIIEKNYISTRYTVIENKTSSGRSEAAFFSTGAKNPLFTVHLKDYPWLYKVSSSPNERYFGLLVSQKGGRTKKAKLIVIDTTLPPGSNVVRTVETNVSLGTSFAFTNNGQLLIGNSNHYEMVVLHDNASGIYK